MKGLPKWLIGKESACEAEDAGETVKLIPGLRRSPGGGHGNSLQYFCLENPHGQRNLVGYSPWGHTEADTAEVTEHASHENSPWFGAQIRKWEPCFFSPQNVFYITETGANV